MSITNSSENTKRRSVFRKKPEQDEDISEENINEKIEVATSRFQSPNSRNDNLILSGSN